MVIGIPLSNLQKDFGFSRTAASSILDHAPKITIAGSYQIWLGRERRNTSSGGELIRVLERGHKPTPGEFIEC